MAKPKIDALTVRRRVEAAASERRWQDQEVLLNREFCRGRQWGDNGHPRRDAERFSYSGDTRSWEARAVHNHLEKFRLLRVAQYAAQPVRFSVVPASNRSSDVAASKTGQTYIDFWVQDRRFKSTLLTAYHYLTTDGTVWLYHHAEGNKDVVTVIPFEGLYVQPGIVDHQRADWIVLTRSMSLRETQQLADHFDFKGTILPSEEWFDGNQIPMVGGEYGAETRETSMLNMDDRDGRFCTTWEHHTSEGIVTVGAGDQVFGDYDRYEHYPRLVGPWGGGMPYPFLKFVEKEVPGQMYGEAMISGIREPQANLNRIISLTLDYMNRYAHPPLMIPDQSIDQFDVFTGEPGQPVEYMAHRGEPHFMDMPQIPGQFFRLREDYVEEMQSLSQAHDTQSGSVPGGNNVSGRSLAIMTAAMESAIAVQAQGMKNVLADLAYSILHYAKHLYDDSGLPIPFKVMGEGRSYEAHSFMTADLSPGFSVACDFGSMSETNRGMRMNGLFELWDRGMFVDQESGQPDTERFIRLLDDAALAKPIGQDSIERAREEFHTMSQAQSWDDYIQPQPFEDHETQLREHQASLRRSRDMEKTNPIGWQLNVYHYQETEQMIQQAQMQQMMVEQQGAAGPQPNGPSGMPGLPGSSDLGVPGEPTNPIEQADQMAQQQAAPVMNEAEQKVQEQQPVA